MKTLKDILTESILSSDDDLNNREVFDIKVEYKCEPDELREFKSFTTINKEKIKSVATELLKNLDIVNPGITAYINYAGEEIHKNIPSENVRVIIKDKEKILFAMFYCSKPYDFGFGRSNYWTVSRAYRSEINTDKLNSVLKEINKNYK